MLDTLEFHRVSILRRLAPALLGLALAWPAHAAPAVGFIEDFTDGTTGLWSGGSLFSNPGTGGFGGSGDGYLQIDMVSPGNFGVAGFGSEYVGNWTSAGIVQVRVRLKDIGATGDLLIHLSIGNNFNFWQQDLGFVPPSDAWAEYVVNLNAADFTRIRGTGTFAAALQSVDRLHFRHDLAPYLQNPDPVAGSLGIDHIMLTDGSNTGVGPGAYAPVLLDPPFPNPARGRVTFLVRPPESSPVRLTVLDAAGRRVRRAELSGAGGAPRLWLWDGTDDAGRPLAAGVYRVIARGDHGGTSRTVTLLR